jgi:hypothetical protein
MAWQRLIKFIDPQGQTRYGDPIIDNADELAAKLESKTLKAKVLEGSSILDLQLTGSEADVAELVGPLTPADVPIVKCIGLNYMKHSKSPRTGIRILQFSKFLLQSKKLDAHLHHILRYLSKAHLASRHGTKTSPPTQFYKRTSWTMRARW